MTSDETKETPAAKSIGVLRGCLVIIAILYFIMLMPSTHGTPWIVTVPLILLLGWIPFLVRNVTQMEPSGETFLIWIACVLLAIGVVQLVMTPLWRKLGTSAEQTEPVWRFRWTAAGVILFHALFVGGLATVGAIDQTYWMMQGPFPSMMDGHAITERRMESANRLKRLGLAAHNYHDDWGRFPQSDFSKEGEPRHSWMVKLLPFLEERQLYESIELDKSWDDPSQRAAYETRVKGFENPGILEAPAPGELAPSHFASNVRMLGPRLKMEFRNVTDGTSNTILMGEVMDEVPAWGDPINWRDPALGVNKWTNGFGSPSVGGAQFLFVDGSVHFLRDDIDPEVLKALSTPAGGEANHEFR
ncbi:DUF1559 domain-containing protein [Blastopirellula sp. JC732]|uniref:DUF1559 domain-containing protein n=1 Tax=Blastopirellula sediminis TaxID=2894196 RepID=A0A9X1MQJ8_9BACT|nr:DUF1559 domain-containing protein [Blastopirellula sediminis]MCC9606500.1 DUF1559 domain-containing protein [Blastopirellula sediminis]MCC9630202.1 DUF1559 domain-containing protein [Blastopirellula sediminis]